MEGSPEQRLKVLWRQKVVKNGVLISFILLSVLQMIEAIIYRYSFKVYRKNTTLAT